MPVHPAVTDLVAGGRCWGLELEPTWRVLGVTVEPDGGGDAVQLLCSPVSVLLASLVRTGATGPTLVTFDADRLPDVGTRLGGARIGPAPFGVPEPRPGAWGPRYSLEGRSSAADGTASTLLLELEEDDAVLRLFARFDDAEVRTAAGALLAGPDGPVVPGAPGAPK